MNAADRDEHFDILRDLVKAASIEEWEVAHKRAEDAVRRHEEEQRIEKDLTPKRFYSTVLKRWVTI